MSFDVPRPDEAAIRAALSAHTPHLAEETIEPLGTGWAFWAYRAGGVVLRFPRDPEFTETLAVEAAVMRELAPALPLLVSVIDVHEKGPNGLPFTSHGLVDGIPIADLTRPLAPNAGAMLGRFLRAMHAFPVERAVTLGLALETPEARRASRRRLFEQRVVPWAFPLISETAREHVTATFEAFLSNDTNFDFQPVVSHSDIDGYNVLADPVTGELTGVIDWGDICIHDPAGDFTSAQYGTLAEAGLRSQLPSLFDAYGLSEAEVKAMRPRCEFGTYCEPLHEIMFGVESRQDFFVKRGVGSLYAAISF